MISAQLVVPPWPGLRHHVGCDAAENAVGSNATRPDDIITQYSGKTVEVRLACAAKRHVSTVLCCVHLRGGGVCVKQINNTDAEGRLVLGDGVACVDPAAEWLCLRGLD